MLAPSGDLLRAGMALKISQLKLAARSYLRDRTSQASDRVTSYAVAAALFAVAGIFVIAALCVGAVALFRWIEIDYGQFPAFGVVGAVLLAIAAICAAVAARKLKPRPRHIASLASRLGGAITASPLKRDQIEAARDTASTILSNPASALPRARRRPNAGLANSAVPAGLIVLGTLLGWAAVRRRHQARRSHA